VVGGGGVRWVGEGEGGKKMLIFLEVFFFFSNDVKKRKGS